MTMILSLNQPFDILRADPPQNYDDFRPGNPAWAETRQASCITSDYTRFVQLLTHRCRSQVPADASVRDLLCHGCAIRFDQRATETISFGCDGHWKRRAHRSPQLIKSVQQHHKQVEDRVLVPISYVVDAKQYCYTLTDRGTDQLSNLVQTLLRKTAP
jgi:hypothetical protein